MKISKITLVLFLSVVLFISSISEINSLNTNKPKKGKKKAIKPENNTFGSMVKAHIKVLKAPWKVERCDQIVITKAKFIPDHEDFTKRSDVVITMTAYYMNLFSAKNPDKLLHSILFSDGKKMPVMQRGARGCVNVDGGRHFHNTLICGKNKKEGRQYLAAIRKFSSCRSGSKAPPKKTHENFKNVMRACGLNSGFTDPKKIKAKLAAMKKKNKKAGNHLRRAKGFFHPGFAGVPGTDK